MIRAYWLGLASAIAVGVWLGQSLYYFTQDLLSCFPLARLWTR